MTVFVTCVTLDLTKSWFFFCKPGTEPGTVISLPHGVVSIKWHHVYTILT